MLTEIEGRWDKPKSPRLGNRPGRVRRLRNARHAATSSLLPSFRRSSHPCRCRIRGRGDAEGAGRCTSGRQPGGWLAAHHGRGGDRGGLWITYALAEVARYNSFDGFNPGFSLIDFRSSATRPALPSVDQAPACNRRFLHSDFARNSHTCRGTLPGTAGASAGQPAHPGAELR